jgi:hypothetical protein
MPFLDNGGTFNVGTDHSLVITNNQTGAVVRLDGRRTSFSADPKEKVLTSEPVDNGGLTDNRVLANGWSGTIEVDRATDDFSALYAFMEANYYQGGKQQFFTIRSTEPNADQSRVNVYQFTRVAFHGYKPGTWTKENMVKVSVQFQSQQRLKIQ